MRGLPLYPRLLASEWPRLAQPIRDCHDASPRLVATGRFRVTHKKGWLARLAIALARMPPASNDVALRLEVDAHEDHQTWVRYFGDFRMTTTQSILPDGRMGERRGPLELLFRLVVEEGAVVYRPVGLRLRIGPLRIPLPSWFGPSVVARAWSEPGGACMHVMIKIAAPLLGELVTYGGALSATALHMENERSPSSA